MPHSRRFKADHTAPDHSGEGNSFCRGVLVQGGNAMSLLAVKKRDLSNNDPGQKH
jgi:hypothetical protein